MYSGQESGRDRASAAFLISQRLDAIDHALSRVCDLCPEDAPNSAPMAGIAAKLTKMEDVLSRLSSVIRNVHLDFQTEAAASNPAIAVTHAIDTLRDLLTDAERIRMNQEAALDMAKALHSAMPSLVQEARGMFYDGMDDFDGVASGASPAGAMGGSGPMGLADQLRDVEVRTPEFNTQAERDGMEDAMAFLSALH